MESGEGERSAVIGRAELINYCVAGDGIGESEAVRRGWEDSNSHGADLGALAPLL